MTDQQALFEYRLQQAEETLMDSERMLEQGISPRSTVNRAYSSTPAKSLITKNW
jgi:hypothetical protein